MTYPYTKDGMPVRLSFAKYENGRIAITLMVNEGGFEEPLSVLTVNIPEYQVPPGCVFVKNYSENEGMLDWAIKNKIVDEPITHVSYGYVEIPVCKLLMTSAYEFENTRIHP